MISRRYQILRLSRLLKSIVFQRVSLAALLFVAAALGQTTANIGGTVRDATGAVLREVKISARNVETGTTRTATTDESGRFLIPGVPVGRYDVRAEIDRFRP